MSKLGRRLIASLEQAVAHAREMTSASARVS